MFRPTTPEDPPPETPAADRFAWLRDKPGRRSALIEVEAAVKNEWDLDASGRADLVRELESLRRSGELTERESRRVERILLALVAAVDRAPRG